MDSSLFSSTLPLNQAGITAFDGKQARTPVRRRTVDMNITAIQELETRIWQRDHRDRPFIQPDPLYFSELTTPSQLEPLHANVITTKFVRTAANKSRCPIFCVTWTPEGRRLITGASSGEFTLWNGLSFNFETILQAHDALVRDMKWSHDDLWMLTTDHNGFVKYWQANMNNVITFRAHEDPCRCLAFSPTDVKFATCSDDGFVKIFDFYRSQEERTLRGHGSDVKAVDWHPEKGLLASGSKDTQQPVILWDPRSGKQLCTLNCHNNIVSDVSWNKINGNWLVTASRDHLIKVYDIRMMANLQTLRGHKKEVCCVAWHPIHEGMLASGGSDGSIYFWWVGSEQQIGSFDTAHEKDVWSLSWHPLGHILCSGSNDHTSKFWTRHRPGEDLSDMKFNRDISAAQVHKEPHMVAPEPEPELTVVPLPVSDTLPGLSSKQELDIINFSSRLPNSEVHRRVSFSDFEDKRFNSGPTPRYPPIEAQKNPLIQPQHSQPPRQYIEPEPTTFRSHQNFKLEPLTSPTQQNTLPGLGMDVDPPSSHGGPSQHQFKSEPHTHLPPPGHTHQPEYTAGHPTRDLPPSHPQNQPNHPSPHLPHGDIRSGPYDHEYDDWHYMDDPQRSQITYRPPGQFHKPFPPGQRHYDGPDPMGPDGWGGDDYYQEDFRTWDGPPGGRGMMMGPGGPPPPWRGRRGRGAPVRGKRGGRQM